MKEKEKIWPEINHKLLLSIEPRFKGGQLDRDEEEDSDGWRPDCSCGCHFFVALEGSLGRDWGVCANKESPRCGMLTFEHTGCPKFVPKYEPKFDSFQPKSKKSKS